MSKTKDELLAEAKAAGVTADESMTNAEIQDVIDGAANETPGHDPEGGGALPDIGAEPTTEGGPVDANMNPGDRPGTDVQPRTAGLPDPAKYGEMSAFRFAERHPPAVDSVVAEDGKTLRWVDPDAVPGTIGDSAEETIKALRNTPAVQVDD